MLAGDTGLTLETGTEGSGYRPSPETLSGVAASTWLPLAHPTGRRHRAGQSRAWGHSRVWWGQLPHLPGVGAARWGLAVGRQHLTLPWLLAPMAGSVVIPRWGAQHEQGPANRNPQSLSPACASSASHGSAGLRSSAPPRDSPVTTLCLQLGLQQHPLHVGVAGEWRGRWLGLGAAWATPQLHPGAWRGCQPPHCPGPIPALHPIPAGSPPRHTPHPYP